MSRAVAKYRLGDLFEYKDTGILWELTQVLPDGRYLLTRKNGRWFPMTLEELEERFSLVARKEEDGRWHPVFSDEDTRI